MALMTLSVFHIIVEEFYPVVFKMLFQFIGHLFILSLLKVQHFSQLDAFLFQIFCCRSAAVFGITVLLDHTLAANLLDRWPNIWLKKTLCTEEVVVESVTARWTGPAAAKLAQVITLCFIISICADMLVQGCVHFGQTSPLSSRLSKGGCSRSLVVCSDATWQTLATLPCSVLREEAFS